MKILITGAHGQLGTELQYLLDERHIKYQAPDSKVLDVTQGEVVNNYFNDYQPDVVYHCAAYTAVDAAEDDGKKTNDLVNNIGTANIADACKQVGATLVYISTDYIFDGESDGEYREDSIPNPKNEYGRAKLQGELAVRKILDDYYIVRTSWVFGKYGKNFVYTMRKLANSHGKLTVVDDQYGRPTWTRTLAEFISYLVDNEVAFGTYQLSNEGSCSWYEFASEILKDSSTEVIPVTSESFPQKAYRPRHSIMSLEKAEKTGFQIPTWQQALHQFMISLD